MWFSLWEQECVYTVLKAFRGSVIKYKLLLPVIGFNWARPTNSGMSWVLIVDLREWIYCYNCNVQVFASQTYQHCLHSQLATTGRMWRAWELGQSRAHVVHFQRELSWTMLCQSVCSMSLNCRRKLKPANPHAEKIFSIFHKHWNQQRTIQGSKAIKMFTFRKTLFKSNQETIHKNDCFISNNAVINEN